MELPIIISNHGDAEVFKSIEEVQDYIEPVDVLDNQYIAYDSKGHILSLFVKSGQVCIQDADIEITDSEELRRIIIQYLSYAKISPDWLNHATLEQLVEERVNYEQKFNGHS